MTLPAIFVVMTFMMWNWWSVYLSGELKSAMNRRRQMTIMFGALAWDVIFIALGAALLFKVTGFDFVVAANTPDSGYAIPGGAFYQSLAALVYNIPILTVLIVGSFLFWSLPAMVGNTFMPIRTVFAWAFDRLLPEKLAEVNERTHSPVPAILLVMGIVTAMLAWSIWSTDFNTWLALGVLAGVVCVVIVAVAAFIFPSRRPDLYQASPANVKVGGIPVLRIVAPLSILVMAFLVYCVVAYPPLALGSSPTTPGGSRHSSRDRHRSASSSTTAPSTSGGARASTSTWSTASCHRSDRDALTGALSRPGRSPSCGRG